jgi:hypothetical protein
MSQIQNRPAFSYDVNSDALYQQYKDQYIRQGKLAMARGRLHFIVLLVLLAHMGSDSLIRIH